MAHRVYVTPDSCLRAQGFYAVYEGLFEKLARQEETAFERREERGRNQREFDYPARFGEPLQCEPISIGGCHRL